MSNELAVHEQIATFTEAVSRAIFAARHGLQYAGDRDIYQVGGYPRQLSFNDFTDLYDRDPIAGQVVDMPAEGTWRVPPEVNEKDADGDTRFSEAFTELADRLKLWGIFERADRMARIGQYSVILIGTTGGSDQTMVQPLSRLGDPSAVLFLKAYNQSLATIKRWVTEPTDVRFGLPASYDIDLSSNISGFTPGSITKIEVDASRVIHVAEGLLNDDIFGRPALQRIYNALHDLQKIETSTAEAFWQRVAGILTAKMDTQKDVAPLDATELAALDTALKELYHDLRRTFAGRGIELSRLSESEPNPSDAADLYFTLIAAGSAIPKRLLFGSETGERASSEDAKTYLGMISERQTQHAEPRILRPFVDRMIDIAVLPRPKNGYEVVWPTLFEESERDQAEANKLRADAAKSLTPMGGDPIELIEIDDERNIWLVPRAAGAASPFEALEPPQPPDGGQGPEPPPATPDAAGNVFDPNQPRVPAGSGDPSGEWVGGDAFVDRFREAVAKRGPTDFRALIFGTGKTEEWPADLVDDSRKINADAEAKVAALKAEIAELDAAEQDWMSRKYKRTSGTWSPVDDSGTSTGDFSFKDLNERRRRRRVNLIKEDRARVRERMNQIAGDEDVLIARQILGLTKDIA